MAEANVKGKSIAEVREALAKAGAHPLVDQVVREIGAHLPHVDGKKGDKIGGEELGEDDPREIVVSASWNDEKNSDLVSFAVAVEIKAAKGKR